MSRNSWKHDLSPYLAIDTKRSLGQIASVVLPYLGIWILAAATQPAPGASIALGLIATIFLSRMYSLFHDLTHNSLFVSRATNRRFGHLLGFFLFTPYRWWQRQHALHHANTGNLDKRGPGEIYTMTRTEYERASRWRRLGYRAYRNPVLILLVGPALVFLFARRFPQRQLPPRAPPQREDPELPAARRARGAADLHADAGGDDPQQHRLLPPQAVGRVARLPRPLPATADGRQAAGARGSELSASRIS